MTTMYFARKHCYCFRLILLVALPVLCVIITILFQCTVNPDQVFTSPFAEDDIRSLALTLATVLNELNRLNVTYFMNGGTLLGSYRHHGRIPWDDDVDLILNSSDKQLIWRSMAALKPDYGLFMRRYIWKFYPRRHGHTVPLKTFRWPLVDLFFFVENETHLWNEMPWWRHECWPRSTVFPLRPRPFGDFRIPAPCDVDSAVAVLYDTRMCVSRSKSHAYDLSIPWRPLTVPCATLAHRHPMVVRRSTASNNGRHQAVAESLMLGNRTLHTIILHNGCS